MLEARARQERLGWKADVAEVRRAVDGAVKVQTLTGYFNSRDEALAAAQAYIDRKSPPAPSAETETVKETTWVTSAEEDD